MRKTVIFLLLIALFCSGSASAAVPADDAEWQSVAPGIDYRKFQLPDPNNVFVARMDRNNPQVTLEVTLAQGKLTGGRETVSSMFESYDQALNSWGISADPNEPGTRNQAVVGINGTFFDMATGVPDGGIVQDGWYVKRYDKLGGWGGFAWKLDRTEFISECLDNQTQKQFVTDPATGQTQEISWVNVPRVHNKLVLYTPQYDTATPNDDSGVEVVVQLSQPSMIMPQPADVSGIVREVRVHQGKTPIPFDSVVLSAAGGIGQTLQDNVKVGSEVRITQEITSYAYDCSTPMPLSWTKTYSSIQGAYFYLKDGQIRDFSSAGATIRNPLSAIAYNDQYVYFIVVDGRSSSSIGMTIYQLAEFSRDVLGATSGVSQDGGGSSTLVVNGQVVNSVAGHERTVSNGLLMVVVQPGEFSTEFAPGESVATLFNAEARLGPGTNYDVLTTIPMRTYGRILDQMNGLDGVLAKSTYWWYVDFGDVAGWVPQEALTSLSTEIHLLDWFTVH